ncbi:MAG: metallophosphoesterase, partial [Planctomycetota bacterium]
MTPYTILQLKYLGLAFLVAGILFWGTGRSKTLRASLILRLIVTEALLGGGGAVVFLSLASQFAMTRAFGVVAVLFYGGALWMPLFALFSARRGTQTRLVGVLAALLVLALGFDSFFLEPNRLVLREERMPLAGWTEERPFRLVHVSDLQTVGRCFRENRAVRMVNGLKPDLIVVTGDFVSGPWSDPGPAVEAARAFHGALRARLGVVLIPGHSEPDRVREDVVRDLGVTYLVNGDLRFPLGGGRELVLWGIDSIYPELPPADLRKNPDDFVVVASHVPDFILQLEEHDFDLHLAGHTHGGQVVIPGFGPPLTLSKLPREYASGMRR